MLERTLEKLRFPIGQFHKPDVFTTDLINGYIRTIEVFPLLVRESVEHLSDVQLDTPYRLGGWTIRQVVHHCADSHLNSFIRFKLALTEESPTINPYDEGRWAELPDTLDLPVTHSLTLLDGLHARWAYLLKSLDGKQLQRTFIHPASGETYPLAEVVAQYDWHCRHHLGHIKSVASHG